MKTTPHCHCNVFWQKKQSRKGKKVLFKFVHFSQENGLAQKDKAVCLVFIYCAATPVKTPSASEAPWKVMPLAVPEGTVR